MSGESSGLAVANQLLLTCSMNSTQKQRVYKLFKEGHLLKLGPSAYVDKQHWHVLGSEPDGPRRQALARIQAVARSAQRSLVVGKSAALIHGLPLESFTPPRTIELGTTIRTSQPNNKQVKWRTLREGQHQYELKRTSAGEIMVASVLDTCRDLALWHSVEDAVIAAEYALHNGLLDWEEWQESESGLYCRHGAAQAREAYKLITPWSESPRESLLKIELRKAGLPAPFQQATIRDKDGYVLGRPDLYFKNGLAVEYDGSEKYGDTKDEALLAFRRERARESSIAACGVHFQRVNAENFRDGSAVRDIVQLWNMLNERGWSAEDVSWSSPGKAWRE